jgi:hypothetical protein
MKLAALVFALTPLACAPVETPPPAQAPPVPGSLSVTQPAGEPLSVLVSSAPDVANFRLVFERTLGRGGFRVLHPGDATTKDTLAVTLIGDGSGTSGSIAGLSYAKQKNTVDATVSRDGRLVKELHTGGGYNIVEDKDEKFDAFNARVAKAASQTYEFMAIDLANQLGGAAH